MTDITPAPDGDQQALAPEAEPSPEAVPARD